MAIVNTGAVERTITGVNTSDLFLDESSSTVNNTGTVERAIEGKHDANFVKPIGDEIFDNQELTPSSGWVIGEDKIDIDTTIGTGNLNQLNSLVVGSEYVISLDANLSVGRIKFQSDANGVFIFSNNIRGHKFTASTTSISFRRFDSLTQGYIENVSVKEVLVNRESTVNNTGTVERGITGVNTSEAFNNASRTNLVPFSEDFSQWTKGSTAIVEGGFSSPDGENNAYKITKTGTAQPYVFENLGLSTTTKRSIFARTVSGTGTVNLLSHNSNTNNLFTITENWQRFEVDSSNAAGVSNFYAVDFRGASTLTEVVLFGADATNSEAFIPTYIKTSGAAATVDSDSTSVINNTGAVERGITGVNESDEMFPDNTNSTIINL